MSFRNNRLRFAASLSVSLVVVGLSAAFFSVSMASGSGDATLPLGIDADWWAKARQGILDDEYALSWQAPAWHGANRAQGFRTSFTESGPTLTSRIDTTRGWTLGLEWVAYGQGGVSTPIPAPVISADGPRIEYRRGTLVEWYVNDAHGLEQGFTLPAPPEVEVPADADHPDRIHLDLALHSSLKPQISSDGSVAEFVSGTTVRTARYDGLHVIDAGGRKLVAWMEAFVGFSGTGIRLVIETAEAVYPITVDPWITTSGWTAESNQDSAFFGWSVASAGDVNGDGFSDVIVGAYRFGNGQANEGRAFVYHGSPTGPGVTADWFVESDLAGAQLGYAVATAGDVNGDGYADVVLGVYTYTNGETNEGQARVYHGSAAGLAATPAWAVESDSATALFGSSVACAGDVNGDGYSDVIVGAPQYDGGDNNEGKAWLYLGSPSGLSTTSSWSVESNQADALSGRSVAGAGDVNGDGYSDVIVGTNQHTNTLTWQGKVEGYFGSASGPSTSPDWTVEGDQVGANLGWSVSSAGDVNGDGYADVIAGAYQYDNGEVNEGRAYVFLGSASGPGTSAVWSAESDQISANFGNSVSTAGDVNGDGYADILVGANRYDNGESDEGGAWLYLGSSGGVESTAVWNFESDQNDAQLGISVAAAGDVDGDGLGDIIFGAHRHDFGESDEGRVWLFYGSPGLLTGGPSAVPGDADWTDPENFATVVAAAGDVNGDGFGDVMVGWPTFPTGNGSGRVRVFHGSASGLSTSHDWKLEHETASHLGATIAAAGDVNGDGYGDVIVGNGRTTVFGSGVGELVWVFHGSPSGLTGGPLAVESDADWRMVSDETYMGVSGALASAGDVNGDGYGDVLIGNARDSLGGSSAVKRVFVFHGSPDGLKGGPVTTSSNADWIAVSDAPNKTYGSSLDSAGDVNGDGFSDIIIGFSGLTFVYHGSEQGLSAGPLATQADADWEHVGDAAFASVATAGDVNGDGFSDVLLANAGVSIDPLRGMVEIIAGSAVGLTFPIWELEETEVDGGLGGPTGPVGSAGDIDGDGYSDIFVTAPGHLGLPRLYVYRGSPTGPAGGTGATFSLADWTLDIEGALGVASSGDVNADGTSELTVNAFEVCCSDTYVFHGNGGGVAIVPQQRRSDDSAPIAQLGVSDSPDSFRVELVGRSPFGRGLVKLEREFKPLGALFDGSGTVVSPGWLDSGTSGAPLQNVVGPLSPGSGHWRARVLHDPVTTPLLPASRWITAPDNGDELIDVRLPIAADLSVTIDDVIDPVLVTTDIGYDIQVANAGPGDPHVTLRHELPEGSGGASSATPSQGTCDIGSETIVCDLGVVVASSSASISVAAAAPATPGTATSTVSVFPSRADAQLANNSDDVMTDVLAVSLGDRVWDDLDGNGVQDMGETGLAGVFVLLLDDSGSLLEFFETDASGAYSFSAIAVGSTYSVRVIPPATHVLSPADQGGDDALDSDIDPLTGQTPSIAVVGGQDPVRWDAGVMLACLPPDEPLYIEGVTLGPGDETIVSFQNFNQPVQVTGYNVYRSSDPVPEPSTWPLIATDVVDGDAATPNHQWVDTSGDVSPTGIWYYHVVAYNSRCDAEGPF